MKKQIKMLTAGAIALSAIGFSCDDNSMGPDINDPNAQKGTLSVSVTDAPIDADNVSAVFVTFTEINIDGETFSGFTGPKTVNLLELQNGNSLNLGSSEATVGSYSNLELFIDSETDDSGSGPGCYIMMADGTKEKLQLSGNGATSLTIKPKNFEVTENGTTEIVMDFDLRKAIKSNENTGFTFVSKGQLTSAVRAENKEMTGMIKGNIENSSGTDLVVYAYKKGEFNENAEINASGNSEVKFAKAVTSAKVDANGNFTLAFLPEGDYEVYCDKPQSNGLGIGLNTLLDLSSNTDLQNVGVDAGAETNVTATVDLGGVLNL